MPLEAGALDEFQKCKRKWALSRNWLLRKWRAKVLADSLLRHGIFAISRGEDATKVAIAARVRLLELAVEPGLDMVSEPYRVAHDWGSLVEIVLRYLGRHGAIPVLRDPPYIQSADWQCGAWADDGGRLHRWITVERWDDEALIRESHSWRTIGDIAATNIPMVLHAVEIGSQREGRRASVWTRAYKHPAMRSLPIRFVKPPDTTWKPFYYLDQREYSATDWLALGERERAFEASVHETLIECPPDAVVEDIIGQVEAERAAMGHAEKRRWDELPMSRGACDLFFPCPYQNICYATLKTPIGKMGLYVPRKDTHGP